MQRIDNERYHYTEFLHDGGSVIFTRYPGTDVMTLSDLRVPTQKRRKGISKMLAAQGIPLAQEIGAKVIVAGITSRESVQVMRYVFGEDSVRISWLGEFGSPEEGTAGAGLFYEVPDPTES